MEGIDPVLVELRRLNAAMNLAFAEQLIGGLSRIATTADRRRIWAGVDGVKTSKTMSEGLKIPRRTVDNFLLVAEEAGLIINERGAPPIRLVDVVPPGWGAEKPEAPAPETAAEA